MVNCRSKVDVIRQKNSIPLIVIILRERRQHVPKLSPTMAQIERRNSEKKTRKLTRRWVMSTPVLPATAETSTPRSSDPVE